MPGNENKTRIVGVHRVTKKLADGTTRKYHYVFRGSGTCFWNSNQGFDESDPRYVTAYDVALRGLKVKPKVVENSTASVLERYRESREFRKLKPRTQKDYNQFLNAFEVEFGEDPISLFEEAESLGEIRKWRSGKWGHSNKRYDYAGTVVTTFLNWCVNKDAAIKFHYHKGQEKLYKSDRSDMIWLPVEIRMLLAQATPEERRIVIAFSEGGLAPQDVGLLRRQHVQRTPEGRRLFFRRQKTNNPVSIPVTDALGELIDAMPDGQDLLVTSLTGLRLTSERASQVVRDLKDRHNAKVEAGDLPERIRDELRPYDLRGTAATALLRAGCSLNEIAVCMGWGLRHAANVIERYAAQVPEVTDEVHRKLKKAKKQAAKAERKARKMAAKRGGA
ncbi:tyrosine-type recombinase/integrase [Pseudooceanicola nanhaiensis]|uniref:tyrosine-type recombinase/integrase n=1 Tax=Pseudooceanicola nanhaiensis TaxID=375761 RepID=UPI003518B48B